jgi:hypothetical protein
MFSFDIYTQLYTARHLYLYNSNEIRQLNFERYRLFGHVY